jgi:hypothetical protein
MRDERNILSHEVGDDDYHMDGEDYVSELQHPTGLLFIPQVISKHGEPWRNDVDCRNLQIHPPECSLAILPAELSNRKSGGSGLRK